MFKFRAADDGTYGEGRRVSLNEAIHRQCIDGLWSGKRPICWSTKPGQACIHSVFPKCGPRTSQTGPSTHVTILGQNFGPTTPTITFTDGKVLKDGTVQRFSLNEIVVAIPPYPEHNEVEFPHTLYNSRDSIPYPNFVVNKTSKGTMFVKNSGVEVFDCRDVDQAHVRRVFPFSYAVGWPANPPLYASDFAQNRIAEIDPDTGITVTRIDHVDGFPLRKPYGLDIGPDGALYVANGEPGLILRYNITGQFLGVWATVPGEPRGIRWLDDHLYVCSWGLGRVLYYRHRDNYNQPNMGIQDQNKGMYRGPFTQEMTSEIKNGVTLDKPYELRFHGVHGKRKLFVASAENGHVLQFDGFNGKYEKVLTSVPVPSVSGFAFSFTQNTHDLFATGFYNGQAVTRFNGANGTFVSHFKHADLHLPGGMLAHDDSLYVTSMDTIKQYSISTGRLIRISTAFEGAVFNFVTIAAQCN